MPTLPLDRLSTGYDLPFLDQIKYAIRSMPYSDTMTLAEIAAIPSCAHDADIVAKQLWKWANEDNTVSTPTSNINR